MNKELISQKIFDLDVQIYEKYKNSNKLIKN